MLFCSQLASLDASHNNPLGTTTRWLNLLILNPRFSLKTTCDLWWALEAAIMRTIEELHQLGPTLPLNYNINNRDSSHHHFVPVSERSQKTDPIPISQSRLKTTANTLQFLQHNIFIPICDPPPSEFLCH